MNQNPASWRPILALIIVGGFLSAMTVRAQQNDRVAATPSEPIAKTADSATIGATDKPAPQQAPAEGAAPVAPEASPAKPQAGVPAPIDKRILGVLPNYRTAQAMAVYVPLTAKQKLTIAGKDSFDWPSLLVAGGYSLLYQAEDQNPSFNQGLKGYARRYSTGYADQVIGNMFSEGFMPALLHEDPRYFRKGVGSGKSRFLYALTRTIVTKTDKGTNRFNFSEWTGNAIGAAIGNAYYPDTRDVSDNIQKVYSAVLTDTFSNVLKEFWPDIKRRYFKKKTTATY